MIKRLLAIWLVIKVGNDGPRDIGWRVGPSYTVGAGAAQFGGGDTMDVSFGLRGS